MASDDEKRRLERARERLQKKAARRRVEQKAARNKEQREAAKSRRRIRRGEPEGAREKAAVVGKETKEVASAAGELAETVPGGKTLKRLAAAGASAAAAHGRKELLGSKDATVRQALAERTIGKPIELESGYEERGEHLLGWYRAGPDGQKHYYVPGNEASRAEAKKRAKKQLPDNPRRIGRPSIRELARSAAVDDEFLMMGTRAEYDPAPPVREGTDHLQPTTGFGMVGAGTGFGPIGFSWGAPPEEREAGAPAGGGGLGMDFRWGARAADGGGGGFGAIGFNWSATDEEDDDEDGGMFDDVGGMDFKW